ncbi:RloB family protein [Mycobacteroides saopaulense]|uniref:RloB-like protein n=1 Tax=Mycobacteroides saopaulense TaxID=1578165 RepID=A0ABX3BVI7_9MYCO|nr:RloB family protein [Mycobacteroides saopaulense]OHT88084.1 hypothetical protein BKG68_08995 [Mycobacteroides saopaulense]OHU06425.1 hypothetical protein BKG73_23140 [Mycobacteroides saopaulense]
MTTGSKRTRTPRRPSTIATRLQIRIFTEGKKTEVQYVNHLYRLHRDQVIISVAPHLGSAPKTVVQAAANERNSDLREEKRGRGSAFSEYWAVFDVDEHKDLDEALAVAAKEGIKVALSSPCLELWFLLHAQPQTAYLHHHDAQHHAKQFLGCEKTLTDGALALLDAGYLMAKQRACGLDAKHLGDQSVLPWNPSSNIWELTETIKTARVLPAAGIPFSCWHLQ